MLFLQMPKKVPHTYVIVFFVVVFAAMLTWVVPGGTFERHVVNVNGIDRNAVVPGSFHYTGSNPQTWQVFSALFDGFVDKADIIVFILIIGGAFWILNSTKAIDVAIFSFLQTGKKIERNAVVRRIGADNIIFIIIMLMFSIFGAVFGMSEETIAFIIIFVPLAISMGYDSITGVSLCFVAAGLGFAGAILNPFTIGIAQGLSDLPLFSGIQYRMFCWLVINAIGFAFILSYASKVKKNPSGSTVYEEDAYWRGRTANASDFRIAKATPAAWVVFAAVSAALAAFSWFYPVTGIKAGESSISFPVIPLLSLLFALSGIITLKKSVHYFIIQVLMFTVLFLVAGVMGYGWYISEISALFFAMGLIAGIAMNYSPNTITKHFLDGVRDIMSAALIVGLAGGIIIILNNGSVIDTMLFKLSQSIEGMGKTGSVSMMYIVQNLINLVMPSGSAKAALTMPVMSQFSDLIGVSRQATVMAFQLGDGFTNMITPVSGVLLGVLTVARIPYEKWFKWVLPLMIVLILTGFLLLIPTVLMDLKGF